MKRVFADLHLRINIKDEKNIRYFIDRAKRFGYSQISFPFNTQLEEGQLNGLKKSCTHAGIDFVARADFRPKNQQDLMKFLRKFRRKLEVICILTDNKEIARQAAKDRRVDILNFPSLDYHKRFFDRAEAELASQSQTALEIDVKSLLVLEGPSRVRLLSCLRREVAIAREFKVPILVSSGVGETHLMRMPRDLASLGNLFGLNETEALDAVSNSPNTIVERNRKKLDSNFVAPGVKILSGGK